MGSILKGENLLLKESVLQENFGTLAFVSQVHPSLNEVTINGKNLLS